MGLLMRPLHALLALCLLAAPALADPLTPDQREAVAQISRETMVQTLRDILVHDPSILRDAVAALQADEQRRQDEAARDKLAALGPHLASPADPVAGNPGGDVTVVEFYDTRCPYCRHMEPVIAKLLQSDPKLKLVWKDLPILGPASQLESRALLAAQKQGGYAKLRQAVMQSAGVPTPDSLRSLADQAGLDGARLLRDMDDPAINARLQANLTLARQAGIEGTPAFVVGDQLIPGAADMSDLKRAVAAARGQ